MPARTETEPGKTYAFLIDVAGQDEETGRALEETRGTGDRGWGTAKAGPGQHRAEDRRDRPEHPGAAGKTNLPDGLAEGMEPARNWCACSGRCAALVQTWKPLRVVIDATGVGEGLWSLLENACGAKVVIPVKFTARLKSELGYGFIGMIESGRYREYAPFPDGLRRQMEHCRSEIMPGPARLMRWGVPDGTRDRASGELVHDDDLMTSALCVMLDGMEWYTPAGGMDDAQRSAEGDGQEV